MGINCLFNSKPLLNCENVISERGERERERGGGGENECEAGVAQNQCKI